MDLAKYAPYMRRAIELAEKGRGRTSPNPVVGAVIVSDGSVIGEGYHERVGGPHAEVNALSRAGERARGATLVVTLEPCSHHGRTPPCADALIAAGVKKVVAGLVDPNPLVAGAGLSRLRAAGIQAEAGLLAEEVGRQNEAYLKFMATREPFVVLKAAVSLDGKIARRSGERTRMSGAKALRWVHEQRGRHDAILVGIGTVLSDDPELTVRLGHESAASPTRVVVDARAELPLESQLVATANRTRTIVAVAGAPEERVAKLREREIEVLDVPGVGLEGGCDLRRLFTELGRREITSVLVEGGSRIIGSLVAEGLIDKYLLLVAPKFVGRGGVELVGAELRDGMASLRITRVGRLGADVLIEAYPAGGRERGAEHNTSTRGAQQQSPARGRV